MDEQTVLAELVPVIHSLKTLALVALDMEDAHPLALPEPPEPDQVAAYEQHIKAIAQQVNPRHHGLLNASLRDYRGGFPDRAGKFLQELFRGSGVCIGLFSSLTATFKGVSGGPPRSLNLLCLDWLAQEIGAAGIAHCYAPS
jgi:hypothetical protein